MNPAHETDSLIWRRVSASSLSRRSALWIDQVIVEEFVVSGVTERTTVREKVSLSNEMI